MNEDLIYQLQGFQDGDTLTADNLIAMENGIINAATQSVNNAAKIAENTEIIEELETQIVENKEQIEENNSKVQENTNSITNLQTSLNGKMDKNVTDDNLQGKILFINKENSIDYKTDAIVSNSQPSTVINGVDYYISNDKSYIHYRGIDGQLALIGSAAAGKVYRVTYGPISSDEKEIEGVPAGTDLKYVLRLWEIDAEDFDGSNPNLENTNWRVVNTHVIGADIERSIISASLMPNNVNNILLSKITEEGEKIYLRFKVNSTNFDGNKFYRLSYTVNIRGLTIRTGNLPVSQEDHEVSLDVTNYIEEGKNIFEISFIDDIGSKDFLSHTINAVNFIGLATFNDKRVYNYNQENVYLEYMVKGSGITKTTYLTIKNNYGNIVFEQTKTTEVDQENLIFRIPTNLAHGTYLITCYSEAYIGAEKLFTDRNYYDLIIIESDNAIPLIGCASRGETIILKQYNTVSIPFYIYNNNQAKPTITKEIKKDGRTIYGPVEEILETQNDIWVYKLNDIGTYIFTIATTNEDGGEDITTTCDIYVKVEELVINTKRSEIVASKTIINFDASLNLPFSDTGKLQVGEEYKKEGSIASETKKPIYLSVNDGFDWVNGGYKLEDGNYSFVIKAGDSITINNALLGPSYSTPKGRAEGLGETGRSFKLNFKVANSTDANIPFMNYYIEEDVKRTEKDDEGKEILIDDKMLSGIRLLPQAGYVYQGYKSQSSSILHLPYSENDEIDFCLTFSKNVNPTPTKEVQDFLGTTIVYGYEDGVSTKPKVSINYDNLKYNDSFTIGSSSSDIVIYKLKVYNTCLTDEEVLTEYILDAKDGETMASRDARNYLPNNYNFESNIIGGNYEDFFNDLSDAYPDLRFILIEAPYFTNHKDDKVSETTVKHWYKGGRNIEDNWIATNAIHRGQGTSSNNYGAAARNLDIDLKEAVIKSMNGGQTVLNNISLTPNSIPNKYFNIKVNVASSENANNALLQKRYNDNNPYLRPFTESQIIDGIVPKDTMEFYNCVVFIRETGGGKTADGEAIELRESYPQFNASKNSWEYIKDNNVHFYALGNIGDSKKTDESRLTDPSDPFEFIVEIADVGLPLSDFPLSQENISYKVGETIKTQLASKWLKEDWFTGKNGSSYGLRFVFDKGDNEDGTTPLTQLTEDQQVEAKEILKVEDLSGFKIIDVCKKIWEDFYNKVTATKKAINSIVFEDDKYQVNYIDETVESYDNLVDLRKGTAPANWANTLEEVAVIDSMVYYSLFTTRYTMVDNRAKNSFWHFGKCNSDGDRKWDLCFDYDNDTALGIDNRGEMNYRYGYEDNDLEDEGINAVRSPVFREHDSTFFCRLVDNFENEFVNIYNQVKNNNKNAWTSSSLIEQFDNWQNQFPERFWKLDAAKKYLHSYKKIDGDIDTTEFLREMACGRKKYQRRQFERNQYNYMGIKYRDIDMPNIYLRAASGNLNGNIIIEVDNYCYLATSTKEMDVAIMERHVPGDNVTIETSGDIYKIWGTPWIREINGLGNVDNLGTAALAKASKLALLDLGGSQSLNNLQLTQNGPMKELDATNAKSLSQFTTIAITEGEGTSGKNGFATLPNLEIAKAEGSALTEFTFYEGAPIKELTLSSYAHTLELPKSSELKNLKYRSATNLINLSITEGSLNPDYRMPGTVVDDKGNIITTKEMLMYYRTKNCLKNVTLNGINWYIENIYTNNIDENTDYELIEYLYNLQDNSDNFSTKLSGYIYFENIDNLSLEKYQERWPDVVFEYNGNNLITKWRVRFHSDLGYTEKLVVNGQTVSAENDVEKLPTDQYYYTFSHWYLSTDSTKSNAFNNGPVKVIKNLDFYPYYNSHVQTYTVAWYKDSGANKGEIVATSEVEYGKAVPDDQILMVENIILEEEKKNDNVNYKLFTSWNKTPYSVFGTLKRTNDGELIPDEDPNNFCHYQKNVVEICALWDTATRTITNTTDTLSLTPAEIGKLLKTGDINLTEEGVETSPIIIGDKLQIPFGFRMPNETYFGKAPIYPFGKEVRISNGKDIIDSEIKLLEKNRDWTLLLDISTITRNSKGGCVFNCYSPQDGVGLQIFEGASNSYKQGRYKIKWYGVDYEMPLGDTYPYSDGSSNPTGGTHREIMVLQHKMSSPEKLFCFVGNHYGESIIETTIQSNVGITYIQNNISFGGSVVSTLGATDYLSETTMHQCILWDDLLSNKDIEQLIQWPKEDFYWVVVNGNGYVDDTDKITPLELWCLSAIERSFPQFDNKKTFYEPSNGKLISFGNTGDILSDSNRQECLVATWLNNRFYNAIPRNWKKILAKAKVPCSTIRRDTTNGAGYVQLGNTTSEMYVWLPSAYEILGEEVAQPEGPSWKNTPYVKNSDNCYRTRAPYLLTEENKIFIDGSEPTDGVIPGDLWKQNGNTNFYYWTVANTNSAKWLNSSNNSLLYRTVAQNSSYKERFSLAIGSSLANFAAPYGSLNYQQNYIITPCLAIKEE